ncbi:MAG: SGNH/GDSL hydrolase family protein [Bacteroidetes bacterium]|nr:SGNH/GDSL hydrolase family protein [Bacteroidota bacterium]MCW5894421.1 SGNH/GDSL hydrolase family protein [Bacteroidota bacterium]
MSSSKKSFILFFTSILVSLLFAETIVRLFVPQETKRLAVYDKELGWRGKPGGSGVYIRNEDSIYVPFQYNSMGFRDDEVRPRNNVAQRILFLGDSFVENLEVSYEKMFVPLVRKRIADATASRVDLVALSSQGYSTAQELLAFRKYRAELRPDYVVLFFYTGNDFEDNLRPDFASLDSAGTLIFPENKTSWMKQQLLSFKRWLYESSYLVFYIKNVIESYAAVNLGDESKHAATGSDEYSFEITRRLILEMRRSVEEHGGKFALVIFTNKYELSENRLEKTAFIKQVCDEAGISWTDATAFLREEHFFRIDEHFSEAGHHIVAERVYDFLIQTFPLED